MPPRTDHSADRHLGKGHFTRLDSVYGQRLQVYMDLTGLAAGRVIKQAVQDFLDRTAGEQENVSDYAESVIQILHEHFPGLAGDTLSTQIIRQAVARQALSPSDSFEVIVDDPVTANWRLKACRGHHRSEVRLSCHRMTERDADVQLKHIVNDALSALHPGDEKA